MGYNPEIILAGRKLNDSMGEYVASQVVKLMAKKNIALNGAELLMLGIAFKENCPDVRNTKIVDVIASLNEYEIRVSVYDPWVNPSEVLHEYNLETTNKIPDFKYDAIILGVAHQEFLTLDFKKLQKENSVLYDVKGILSVDVDGKL
jgi:UDP-N-acetyl-D-galactosamine dehydrogenase